MATFRVRRRIYLLITVGTLTSTAQRLLHLLQVCYCVPNCTKIHCLLFALGVFRGTSFSRSRSMNWQDSFMLHSPILKESPSPDFSAYLQLSPIFTCSSPRSMEEMVLGELRLRSVSTYAHISMKYQLQILLTSTIAPSPTLYPLMIWNN